MKKLLFLVAGVALIATAAVARSGKFEKSEKRSTDKNKSSVVEEADAETETLSSKPFPHPSTEFLKQNTVVAKSRVNDRIPVGYHKRGTPGTATKGLDSHNR